jgi:hypothetical protein
MGERRGVYRVLMGKPDGKRPLGEAYGSSNSTNKKIVIFS